MGERLDRVPVMIWRYFPGDDQMSAELVRSLLDYQNQFENDALIIAPSPQYQVADHGVASTWNGDLYGQRHIYQHPIQRSLDWTDLRVARPDYGEFARVRTSIDLLSEHLPDDLPRVLIIDSPLTQAAQLAGDDLLVRTLRRHAERLHTGLNTLTETTLRWIDHLKRHTRLDGLYYRATHASYHVLAEAEYMQFGLDYDHRILDDLPRAWWLNILAVGGHAPMLGLFGTLPVQGLVWESHHGRPTLDRALQTVDFQGFFGGGLPAPNHIQSSTTSEIRESVRESIATMRSRRLLLTNPTPWPLLAPQANLRAIRQAADEYARRQNSAMI